MARPKRVHPALATAQRAIAEHAPELSGAPIDVRLLDGPPGSPRYAAMAEACLAEACPHGITREAAAAGRCHVLSCPLRSSVRILLDGEGHSVQVTRGGIHWS